MSVSELEKIVAFRETPGDRLPCLLLLDTSSSMQGERISALNAGIKELHKALLNYPKALSTVELAVMTFDSDIKLVHDFVLAKDFTPPTLTAQNQTFMGQALIEALDCIEQRKQLYLKVGSPFHRPLIFMLTDGQPEGEPPGVLEEAKSRVRHSHEKKRVKILPVCVGKGIDPGTLTSIAGDGAVRLDEAKWKEMFVWLSVNLEAKSRSRPDEQTRMTPPNWTTM
jgi:uncharacterized protein YegL